MRLWPVDHAEYAQAMTAVRAQLDESAFQAAWTAGRTLSLDQIIEEAITFAVRA